MIPLIRQKSFLEKTKKGGWARDVTKEGGSGGASPPAFKYHHLKTPNISVTPDSRQSWVVLYVVGSEEWNGNFLAIAV